MPEISKDTEVDSLNMCKFIRVGDIIYISDDGFLNHAEIADEYGVTESVTNDGYVMPVVDDAGMIKLTTKGLLKFDESTTRSQVRGNKVEARKRTIEIGKGLFGKSKVSDDFYAG